MIGREGYSETNLQLRIGSGASFFINLLTCLIMIRPWINNRQRIAVWAIGTFLSLTCSVYYCHGMAQYLAALTLYVAMAYIIVIRDMLAGYLDLVARKLTMKEERARNQGWSSGVRDNACPCCGRVWPAGFVLCPACTCVNTFCGWKPDPKVCPGLASVGGAVVDVPLGAETAFSRGRV